MTEVHDVIFTHTRESKHTDKCGRIVCLQEEDPSVKIGQDCTALEVEVSEGYHHEESIDNERYDLVNVDMESGLVRGYGPSVVKTS